MCVCPCWNASTYNYAFVRVLFLFVCKIDSAVLWLPGIISSSHTEISDKARANIFINGRMVKRHRERTEMLSYCGASPGFWVKCWGLHKAMKTLKPPGERWMSKSQDKKKLNIFSCVWLKILSCCFYHAILWNSGGDGGVGILVWHHSMCVRVCVIGHVYRLCAPVNGWLIVE